MKKLLTIFITVFFAYCCVAQQSSFSIDIVNSHFLNQFTISQQEKIYVHTDRSLYIQGEKIWLRVYLVNAVLHQQVSHSRYVYVELVNRQKQIVSRIKIRPVNNLFFGYINLPQTLTEGEYSLRAYTRYMENSGEDYFFIKNLRIINPSSLRIKFNIDFEYNEKTKKITAHLDYIYKGQQLKPNKDILKITFDDKPDNIYYTISNKTVSFSFDRDKVKMIRATLDIDGMQYIRDVTVPKYPADFDVAFFPEGGYLLTETNCAVAFKALKTDGSAENITGDIVDSDGNIITQIESLHLGMGKFYMVANENKTYYAVCTNAQGLEKRFELPAAKANMYSLRANWVKDNLYISVQHSNNIIDKKDLYLIVHTRGMTQYAAQWNFNDKALIFNKNDFPSGVLHILLVDSILNPISERLAFNVNDMEQISTAFTTNKENYEAREKVLANVKISDTQNMPVKGNFSVAITDDSDVCADTTLSIFSTLLLTSDLKGYIENPDFYFNKNHKNAKEALDALMLTHGWRRYNVSEIIKGNYENPKIEFEKMQKISGDVLKYNGSNKTEGSLVMIYSKQPPFTDYLIVDNAGKFSADDIEFPDSMTFTVKAFDTKGKPYVEIFMDFDKFPDVGNIAIQSTVKTQNEQMQTQEHVQEEIFAYEKGVWYLFIDEAIVLGKRIKKEEKPDNPAWYSRHATQSFTEEKIKELDPLFLSDIIKKIPNVRIEEGKVIYEAYYSMSSPAQVAVLVDGVFIDTGGTFHIDDIDIQNVTRVDIFKRTATQLFGTMGGHLVIAITTGTFSSVGNDKIQFNLKKISPLGFQLPVEFYSPKYEMEQQKNDKTPDLRTTIFWQPNVVVNDDGKADFSFYAADYPTTYTVVIEGLTDDGKIINSINKIRRK